MTMMDAASLSCAGEALHASPDRSRRKSKTQLSPCRSVPVLPGANYIEHRVSKFDTLAGIAIKYGVEVADIKRLNGLVTDLQMFAHRTLQIPLPGRHPPSPIIPNGSATTREKSTGHSQTRRAYIDILDLFESPKSKAPSRKVSPAMVNLQGYYGLHSPNNGEEQAKEAQVNRTRDPGESGVLADVGVSDAERFNDNFIRRRQKVDANPLTTPLLLKEDGGRRLSGNNVGLRSKCSSRTLLTEDVDSIRQSPVSMEFSSGADRFSVFRKSSSTPSFQESESGSIWPTSFFTLNIKPDLPLPVLSTAAFAKPILDLTSRWKAALD